MTVVVFALATVIAGATVAGPGLSWDEPAYAFSQVTLENWLAAIARAPSWRERMELFSSDSIDHSWQYNRFGHNFHPPLAGMLNVVSHGALGGFMDETSARRMAAVFEFALTVAILARFLARRYGPAPGLFASASLLFMPRVMGDAHVIGTDMPLLLFWSATALAFWRAKESTGWQWAAGALLGLLFLVKFSGVVIVVPLVGWWVATELVGKPGRVITRWLVQTAMVITPLCPVAAALLIDHESARNKGAMVDLARWTLGHAAMARWLLAWPLVATLACSFWNRRRSMDGWALGLEMPWRIVAAAPLVTIAFNPTWWHETLPALTDYFELNLHRRGKLPDIGIFYLGERYLYSLPPSNAWVLIGVTVPFGTLALSLIGAARAWLTRRADPLPLFFLVQAMTLPVFRMFRTPAHDGVRLFLPTFFFLAGLAGWGALVIVESIGRSEKSKRWVWVALTILGPAWSAFDWIRIHPYELSYYNIGLPRAVDWGFEPTYWYDAVTPRVVRDLNASLPEGVAVGFPEPLINPETFPVLQELGQLRPDISFDVSVTKTFPWYWLLTHSGKATPYTRLLYACEPWREWGKDGVRLFSIVDPKTTATAWALRTMTVKSDPRLPRDRPVLHESAFHSDEKALRRAVDFLLKNPSADDSTEPESAQRLLADWRSSDFVATNLAFVQARDPGGIERAISLLARRPEDIRKVILTPGYLLPERFGGWLKP